MNLILTHVFTMMEKESIENSECVASYVYDAWGNHIVTNYTSDNIGNINPFRYRGYYFDSETGYSDDIHGGHIVNSYFDEIREMLYCEKCQHNWEFSNGILQCDDKGNLYVSAFSPSTHIVFDGFANVKFNFTKWWKRTKEDFWL